MSIIRTYYVIFVAFYPLICYNISVSFILKADLLFRFENIQNIYFKIGGLYMALYLSDLSDDEIRRIVDAYLQDFATMQSVAEDFNTTATTISNILYEAVSKNKVDDLTADAVATKAMHFTENKTRTNRRWKKALAQRKLPNAKESLHYEQLRLNELNEKKAQLEFQLESYNDYFIPEEDAPSKKSLRCEICRLKGKINASQQKIAELKNEIERI